MSLIYAYMLRFLVAGDSIYRQKYERLRREVEYAKKKMQQQHEEEVEKKEAKQKQLERKVR